MSYDIPLFFRAEGLICVVKTLLEIHNNRSYDHG